MKYRQEYTEADGWTNWIFPVMRRYKMACCDCGLVHDVKFAVFEVKPSSNGAFTGQQVKSKKLRVAMKVSRNNRSSAAHRRERAKKV